MTARAGRGAGLPVPGPQVRPRRLLARRRADQRRRHPAHRQARRRPRRAAGPPRPSSSRSLLAVTFAAWYASERTLSIHSIVTTPPRGVLLAGDPVHLRPRHRRPATCSPSRWASATGPPSLLVAVSSRLITAAHSALRLNAVLAFWLAYILTRPLGASIGDGMSQAHAGRRPGLGTTGTSVIFLVVILALVVFLAVTKVDQTERVAQRDPDDDLDESPPEIRWSRASLLLVRVPAEQAYGDQRHHRRERRAGWRSATSAAPGPSPRTITSSIPSLRCRSGSSVRDDLQPRAARRRAGRTTRTGTPSAAPGSWPG